MIMTTITKVYTEYVLAYGDYIDKYMVNRNEEDAVAENAVCDSLYDKLSHLVRCVCMDDDMHYDVMDILSKTDRDYKIDMANNLKKFFDYMKIIC